MNDRSVFLMPEDISRKIGKDAQRGNIAAAKMLAEVVKTTLGPKGMDKMLVSPTDEIVVTNDGVTILNEMQIKNPVAKMMVEIANTQETEVGDGTTSAVMIAGKLLENAEKLLDMKIHPTLIVKGYRLAVEKSQEILKEIAFKVTSKDREILKQIAMTAMTGKGAEDSKEILSEIIVNAITELSVSGFVNLDDIKIQKIKGNNVKNSELVSGIVFDRKRISYEMPNKVVNAKIAILDTALELSNPTNANISVSSHEQLQNFMNSGEDAIKKMIDKVKESGANVVFCQKGIDDYAQYLLAKENIYACSRVARNDIEKLAKATSAKIIGNVNEIESSILGEAKVVREMKQGDKYLTYVKGCKNPKALSILISGGSEHVIDEVERAVRDGMGDVLCVLRSGLVVLGGGAVEVELSKRLRKFSHSLNGREQLAVEEFANALEFIPLTLAENAGLDPIDTLTDLRSKHDSGDMYAGLNLFENKIENVMESRIIEPHKVKQQAIDSATEVAVMILRIDDVIASSGDKKGMNSMGQMPDYMGGLN